jgi:chromate transporter
VFTIVPSLPVPSSTSPAQDPAPPSFAEACKFWWLLGCTSFGGPAGQIALMHRELVDRRKWISEKHFLQAVQFAMLLPGPEAQQTATYVGWRLHGIRGGLVAGGLFVLPAAILLYILSCLFVLGQEAAWMPPIVRGLNAVVIALIASAIARLSRRTLSCKGTWILAIAAFVLLFVFHFSFVAVVLGAACIGVVGDRILPKLFPPQTHRENSVCQIELPHRHGSRQEKLAILKRMALIAFAGVMVWVVPLAMAGATLGWNSTIVQQGLFFSKAALITFGGAYAVLPYVAQQTVDTFAWLTPSQMMAGLALAESTPGPLIMVLQFVGFVGAWQHPGSLNPWWAGTLGALMTTWVTFIPSYIFVFGGGPLVEHLDRVPLWNAALRGMMAAVIGGMASLGLRFALDATAVASGTPNWMVILLTALCLLALQHQRMRIPILVAACGFAGWLGWFVGVL